MSDERAWFDHLLAESRRDLVFLWNIENGNFGGPAGPVDAPTVMAAIGHLLRNGCAVGFGDPDSENWETPAELLVPEDDLPALVVKQRRTRPRDYEFLTFATRDHLKATP